MLPTITPQVCIKTVPGKPSPVVTLLLGDTDPLQNVHLLPFPLSRWGGGGIEPQAVEQATSYSEAVPDPSPQNPPSQDVGG